MIKGLNMRLKALLLILVFSVSLLPIPKVEAQTGLPDVELTCTSDSGSQIQIHVHPGATLTGFAICTASNPNPYSEKIQIDTEVEHLAISHPTTIILGPNSEEDFQVALRAPPQYPASSIALKVTATVVEAGGIPSPYNAQSEVSMSVEIMQFSDLRVQATESILILDSELDYNLQFKIYNDGNNLDKFRLGVTNSYLENLEDYGFSITIPLASIEIGSKTPPQIVRVEMRTPKDVENWPVNSDGEHEMTFDLEFYAESDFSCEYEVSGCNKESVIVRITVNGGEESGGILSVSSESSQMLVYGGGGAGVIILLMLVLTIRKRRN